MNIKNNNMSLSFQNIVIIGAGNVASHFASVLKATGKNILQIFSKTEISAKQLADKLHVPFTNDLSKINSNADLYILAVTDASIFELAEKLRFPNKIIVHVAGSVPLDIINPISQNTGVLYPVQSLLKNVDRDFSNIPLCVEASNEETLIALDLLANELSRNVYFLNSEQRKVLHLAAVFASNFENYLNIIVSELLTKNHISLNIIQPLIEETARRFGSENLREFQTGPAVRNDKNIIETHSNMLKDNPDYQELYKLFTKIIQKETESKTE